MTTTHHALARVSGYGLLVLPYAPYQMRYGSPTDNTLEIVHTPGEERRYAVVWTSEGGYQSKLSRGTSSLLDVADIGLGATGPDWIIETSIFTCTWPRLYWLASSGDEIAPFYLIGPDGELIFIQRPRQLLEVGEMAGPDQQVIDSADEGDAGWIELEYMHEGVTWRQRHSLVGRIPPMPVIVTVQAPQAFFKQAKLEADRLAESLAPWQEGAQD